MNITELKSAWEHQKEYFGNQLISENDILSAINQDLCTPVKFRRLLNNGAIFLFLFFFCQACQC